MESTEPDPDGVTTRSELGAALTLLRGNADLTVRELARRLDIPSGTLGGYLSGRHLPSNAQLPLLARVIAACGVDDPEEIERWMEAVRRARATSDRRVTRPRTPPYRGLKPFEAEDAGLFFGRSAETDEILARIAALAVEPGAGGGILAVVGPSGSGKSSLLHAGVVAAIRAGSLDTPNARWSVRITTPSGDLTRTLSEAGERSVLILDQFEELFTSFDTPGARRALLRQLADRPDGVVLVLVMRADFYADAAREPALLAALQHAQVVVGPMNETAVREVVSTPARQAGVYLEAGLADLVLADLAPRDAAGSSHDPGALPLLSHALLATWERSDGRRMTVADYRATGGIDGAVQRTAEDLFATLSAAEQDAARRLFLRLVHIDDSVAVTRRRVPPDELARLVAAGVDVVGLVDRFVERRLITASASSVEVTHEALLSAWPRLREWVDADRAGLRLHRQVTDAAKEWDRVDRDAGALLRGTRLDAAAEWAADDAHQAVMDELEVDFVDSALRQRDAEVNRDRRRGRRLRQLLIAVAVLAVVTTVLAVLSLRAYSSADHQQLAATTTRDEALSRGLAAQSQILDKSDPSLAQQLTLVGYRIAQTPEARSELIDRSARPTVTRILGAQGPTALAVSPNGRTIAVGDAGDGSVHLYATRGSAPPVAAGRIPAAPGTAHLFALAFSPDGRVLATGGQDMAVRMWDVSNPHVPRALTRLTTTFTGAIQSIAFSPDRRTLAAAGVGPHPVLEWNVANPTRARALPGPRGITDGSTIQSVSFNPHATLLAAGGTSGVYVWPATTAATTPPRRAGKGVGLTVDAVTFDPTGTQLYAGDKAGTITRWSTTGSSLHATKRITIDSAALINVLALSPDGRELTAGSSDSTVRRWTVSNSRLIDTTGLPGPVTGLHYSPEGRYVLATAADGSLRRWPTAETTIPITGTAFTVGFAAGGSRMEVGTSGEGGVVRVWDTSKPGAPRPLTPPLSAPLPVVDGTGAIRADGKLVAAADPAGQVSLWDLSDPARARSTAEFQATHALPEQLAFSPDGNELAVASDEHSVRLWDVHDPAHPRLLSVSMAGRDLMLNVAFSPDGRFVAGANADSDVYVWDVRDPTHPQRIAALSGFKTYAYGVAFSPNGRLLAAVSADHTTRLWSMHGAARPTPFGKPLLGPTNDAYSVAFAPDSRTIAVASDDATIRLYDVHDASATEPEATLRELGANAFAVAFSPDGKTVVGGGRADALDVWTVDVGMVARSVCAVVGDPITRKEWAEYVPGLPYDPPCRNGKPAS